MKSQAQSVIMPDGRLHLNHGPIDLIIDGEQTELDKQVLEEMADPLLHIVRNAVDHGIEDKEKRVAAGKPEQGRISLRLSREGGYFVLTLSDDGGGINVEAVRKKAIERGLIVEGQEVSDHEVRQFAVAAIVIEILTQTTSRPPAVRSHPIVFRRRGTGSSS